jgi:hypothetical protein
MNQHRQPNGEPQGITGRGAFARFVTACRLMGTKSVPGTVTVVVGRLVLGDTGHGRHQGHRPGCSRGEQYGRRGNPPAQVSSTSTVAGEALSRVGSQVSYRDQRSFGLAGAQRGGDDPRR